MSAISDMGKTVSSVFSVTRKSAELIEAFVGEEFLKGIIISSGKIINTSLSAAAEMTAAESQKDLDDFYANRKPFALEDAPSE